MAMRQSLSIATATASISAFDIFSPSTGNAEWGEGEGEGDEFFGQTPELNLKIQSSYEQLIW